jgi:hypothetical protein
MAYEHEKHFSLPEAEEVLARVRPQIERMAEAARRLREQGFDVHQRQYRPGFHPDTQGPYPPTFLELVHVAQQLHTEGIMIKGLEDGLIDFPHLRADGEEVYLCWKVGEEELAYWHSLYEGFAGRRPLNELNYSEE